MTDKNKTKYRIVIDGFDTERQAKVLGDAIGFHCLASTIKIEPYEHKTKGKQ